MSKVYWFNRIWLYFCGLEYNKFVKGLNNVQQEQEQILFSYVRKNSNTQYGKKYQFHLIKCYQDFIEKVPLIEDWSQLSDEINCIANCEKSILTQATVFAFEQTSGSSGMSKLIPYTQTLRNEFNKSLNVWMYALWLKQPKAFGGKSFWSISPALKANSKTKAGIPIGLENDTEYLDPLSALLMKQVLVDTTQLNRIKDKQAFYITCLTQLLLTEDLSFVSVWSPHYFLVLDDFLHAHFNELIASIEPINKSRYSYLKRFSKETFSWNQIWPNLKVLSCWDSAQSAIWIPILKEKIGSVSIQGKGLMSTEAATSIPYGVHHQPILAYRSHFFEFRDLSSAEIRRAHELQLGKLYEVIVSTGAGLMRYCTKDIVEVTGFEKQVPYLAFKGRTGSVSDKVGEKLHEIHLHQMLIAVWQNELTKFVSVFFYPEKIGTTIAYIMAVELNGTIDSLESKLIVSDQHLSQNPYYQQALSSGQLGPLKLQILITGKGKEIVNYLQGKRNMKLGDFKLPLLLIDEDVISFISN